MISMYILLTGALKNVGDFLIADRCRKLIEFYSPNSKIIEISRYESLDDKLDLVNSSKAIILAGGPGYLPNIYPSIFRLTRNLDDIKVPIIPMGMGWYGSGSSDINVYTYKFTVKSMQLIERIKKDAKYFGARDYYTVRALKNNGINNVLMTGCPAWYDIEYKDKEFDLRSEIKTVVFSTPAGGAYAEQCIKMMQVVKEKYADARLICAFHRGIAQDRFTSQEEAERMLYMKDEAEKLGYEIEDLSYDLSKMSIYDKCDLHVGYRVHAHIYCLSHRVKSILLNEDGRGAGVCNATNFHGVDCYYEVITRDGKLGKATNNFAHLTLANYIDELKSENYNIYKLIKLRLDDKFEVMIKFLNSLPS